MKKLLAIAFILFSLNSFAKSPASTVKAKLVKDSSSEAVYLKLSKLTTNKETVVLKFSNKEGKVIKTVKVTTEHYTTVKKLRLGDYKAEELTVEVL